MARISANLVAQDIDGDRVVLIDDQTPTEMVIPYADAVRLVAAISYLADPRDANGLLRQATRFNTDHLPATALSQEAGV